MTIPVFSSSLNLLLLHIDRWPSHQSAIDVEISGSSRVVERKWWTLWNDICRCPREIQSLESVLACSQKKFGQSQRAPASSWVPSWVQGSAAGLRLITRRPGNRISTKWGLEDNTVWYGQKKKLWVNMTVCIRLLSSVRPYHIKEKLTSRIKRVIFYKEVLFFIPACIFISNAFYNIGSIFWIDYQT